MKLSESRHQNRERDPEAGKQDLNIPVTGTREHSAPSSARTEDVHTGVSARKELEEAGWAVL